MSESNWDLLDCAGGKFYGVLAHDDYSARPIAIFANETDAEEWLKWRTTGGDEGDRLPRNFYSVGEIRSLAGLLWNSIDPSPEHAPTVAEVEAVL